MVILCHNPSSPSQDLRESRRGEGEALVCEGGEVGRRVGEEQAKEVLSQ